MNEDQIGRMDTQAAAACRTSVVWYSSPMRRGGLRLLIATIFGCCALGSCQGEEGPVSRGAVSVEFTGADCQVAGSDAQSIPADAPPATEDSPRGLVGDGEGEVALCTIVPADDGIHVRGHLADGDRGFSVEAVFTTEDGETFNGTGSVEFTSFDTGALWSLADSCTFEAAPPQGVHIIRDIERWVYARFRCESIQGQGEAAGCTAEGDFAFHGCSS